MDTLELIRTFQEVATRGSFSMAARTLDVSKANVSKYVAELETRLGVRLLNRTTRTVSLTDAGSLLLERSKPLVDQASRDTSGLVHEEIFAIMPEVVEAIASGYFIARRFGTNSPTTKER